MRIIEITALSNGAHRNQSGFVGTVPEGWAVIPDSVELPNFPFGIVTAAEIDGVMTVTEWIAGEMPEPEPDPTPSVEDLTIDLLADHEERICLLELTAM